MTSFLACAPTDALQAHETYRLTITPAQGFLSALVPNGALSGTLNAALANIFEAGSIDNVTTFAQALNANPYQPGDLAETIDVLVTSPGGVVADLLRNVLTVANDFSLWSSNDWSSVVVTACERIVGTGAAPIGSPSADAAVNSPEAAATRAAESAAASVSALNRQGSNWLTNLENDIGRVGTVVAIGVGAALLYGLYRRIKGRAV